MEGILPQVEKNVKEKFPIVEIVRKAMKSRGWGEHGGISRLAEASGVRNNVIGRFLKGKGIELDNLLSLLSVLNILKVSTQDEKGLITNNNNVIMLPKKHPELYELLDVIDRSDDPRVIDAARSRLQGVILMEKDDVRGIYHELDRLKHGQEAINDKLDQLIKSETPPIKRTRKPAPGRG